MLNPLSNRAFIEWLESRDPDEEYNYECGRSCLIYRYLKDKGFSVQCVGMSEWTDKKYVAYSLPPGWNKVSRYWKADDDSDIGTMGGALAMAKEILSV